MGELRTIYMDVTGAGEQWTDRLFEKKTRIVAVLLTVSGTAPIALSGLQALLTKNKKLPPVDGDVGHIAHVYTTTCYTTSGGQDMGRTVFFNFYPNYVEVEEDDHLYLGSLATNGNAAAKAILYYEE